MNLKEVAGEGAPSAATVRLWLTPRRRTDRLELELLHDDRESGTFARVRPTQRPTVEAAFPR